MKRLFFDLEVSPNVVLAWSAGYEINVLYQNIIRERAIICACYKWEGEKKIHSLVWNDGDDRELLEKLNKVLESADEVVGHNSDKFDLKWFRTRCAFHGISVSPFIKGVDTLKLSRAGFKFNSNRLDYLGQFFGLGKKMDVGGQGLWKDITLHNDQKALQAMVKYCKRDVQLLEDVYHKLESFAPHKTHVGVLSGGTKFDCPRCTSKNIQKRGTRISAAGWKKQVLSCQDCGRWFTAPEVRNAKK